MYLFKGKGYSDWIIKSGLLLRVKLHLAKQVSDFKILQFCTQNYYFAQHWCLYVHAEVAVCLQISVPLLIY